MNLEGKNMSQQKLNEKKFKIYKYVLFYSLLYLLFFSTLSNVVNDLGYEFLIWLDYERAENDMQGKVLNYQFELLQGTNL